MTGKLRLRIRGACPEDCLQRMALCGIRFYQHRRIDDLTAEFVIGQRDLTTVNLCAKKAMCELEVLHVTGVIPGFMAMGARRWYLLVLSFLIALVFFIQGHVLFLEVTGNTTIPEEQILQILDENGIRFWTSSRQIQLNLLKNEILSEIPELGWITINTEGPIGEVVVRQREEKPAASENSGPANVLAVKNGIIESVSVTGGTPSVVPGDVVTPGQMLISGVTNLDKTLLLSRAEGEVMARTFTRKTAILSQNCQEKSYTGRETTKFSITFGKNTINFYKTSGISYDNYDKMTVRNTLTLPGGYQLPLTLTVTTFREYELQEIFVTEDDARILLTDAVRRDTEEKLLAGTILGLDLRLDLCGELYTISGVAECREEIGMSVEIKD